jgi:hypothetical protein
VGNRTDGWTEQRRVGVRKTTSAHHGKQSFRALDANREGAGFSLPVRRMPIFIFLSAVGWEDACRFVDTNQNKKEIE